MTEHKEDHGVVIVDNIELIEIQPWREAGQGTGHQHRRPDEGRGESDKVQPPSVAPVFHDHEAGNKQVEYQQKYGKCRE